MPPRVSTLHVLAHFVRILLAAGLLAGIVAGGAAGPSGHEAPGRPTSS